MAPRWFILSVMLLGLPAAPGTAQDNPVYVDEAPIAMQILEQADASARLNPAESIRLLQELLEVSGAKLVPRTAADEPLHFISVRQEVLRRILADEQLLTLYRRKHAEAAATLLEEDELELLLERYELTQPGLEALLRLGRRDIEEGALVRGMRRLQRVREHPDANTESLAHAWYGIAISATLLGDEELRQVAVDALASLGQPARVFLDSLQSMEVKADTSRAYTIHRPAPMASIEDLVVQSIWSMDLEASLFNRRIGEPNQISSVTQGSLDGQADAGWFNTIVPSVHEDLVIVNLGQSIVALDTLTGQVKWVHTRRMMEFNLYPNDRPTGINAVELDGRVLVTAMGHLYGDERSGDGSIVCLDAETGWLAWDLHLDGHPDIPQSEGLFASSPVLAHDGIAYVLARKMSRQQLASEVLVAIDLAGGHVLWATGIAHAGNMRRNLTLPTSIPLPIDGRIIVSTSIGAVASLDASTGALLWLQRLPTLPSGMADLRARPFTHEQPVEVPGGIVTLSPDKTEILELDLENGNLLSSITATGMEGWNRPLYMIGDGRNIISVGSDVRCFEPGNLNTPRWILPLPEENGSTTPIGRVQLLENSLIIPTHDRILQADLESGVVLRSLAIPRQGNPLVAGPQLLVASATHLDAYTAFDRAEDVLQDRIAAAPDSIKPRLDLVRLAARAENDQLLLPATRDVLRLLEEAPAGSVEDSRSQLLGYLVTSLQRRPSSREIDAGTLSELILETAHTPHQELEGMLVLGDWNAPLDPQVAAGYWREILSREELASTWFEEDGLHARGDAWAHRRLANLDIELGEVDLPAWREPDATDELADQIASIRDNLRSEGDPIRIEKELSSSLVHMEELEEHDVMIALLHSWNQRYPGVPLMQDGVPTMVETRIRDIVEESRPTETAAHGDQENLQRAHRATGTMLPTHPDSILVPHADAVLLQRDDTLRKTDPLTLEELWSTRLPGSNVELLQHDREQVVTWIDHGDMQPVLHVLDTNTGEPVGDTIEAASLFKNMLRLQPGIQSILPDGRMIDPQEILPCSSDDSIMLVRRDGSMVGLETGVAGEAAWQHQLPIRVVHDIMPWPGGCMVIGPNAADDNLLAVSNADPAIFFVEHGTGAIKRVQWPDEIGRFSWLARSPLNDMILGGESGIAAIGWPDHEPRWMNTTEVARNSQRGWASGDVILLLDQKNGLQLLDIQTGHGTGMLSSPMYKDMYQDEISIQGIQSGSNGFLVLRNSGLAIHDPGGQLIGADSIPSEAAFEHMVELGPFKVIFAHQQVVSTVPGQSGLQGRRHLYRAHVLDSSGRALDVLDLFPLESRIRAVRTVGDVLLVETEKTVDAISLPPVPAR